MMRAIIFYLVSFMVLTSNRILAQSTLDIMFQWPIETDKIEQKLSSLFGESRGDHFHNGVDISSDNEPVKTMGDAVILYSRYSSDNPFENEHGSGNCIWLNHESGILSAYYHLKDGRMAGLLGKSSLKKGEVIAKSGNTGHSSGSHLHFIVAINNGKKIINALTVLPFVSDTTPPSIGTLTLSIGNNYTYINDGDNINVSKNYPLSIDVHDTGIKKGQRRGIKALKFDFNGIKIKESKFGEISLKNDKWINEDKLSFNELYYEGKYYIGDLALRSGENTINIIAIDYNDNKSEKSISFNVNRISKK